jgi:hypothetical protein
MGCSAKELKSENKHSSPFHWFRKLIGTQEIIALRCGVNARSSVLN